MKNTNITNIFSNTNVKKNVLPTVASAKMRVRRTFVNLFQHYHTRSKYPIGMYAENRIIAEIKSLLISFLVFMPYRYSTCVYSTCGILDQLMVGHHTMLWREVIVTAMRKPQQQTNNTAAQ